MDDVGLEEELDEEELGEELDELDEVCMGEELELE